MPIFKNFFKKNAPAADAKAPEISGEPVKSSGKGLLKKGTGAVAIISTIALAKKYGPHLIKKIKEKVHCSVNKNVEAGVYELKKQIKERLEKFIVVCAARWFTYIGLIMCAYFIAQGFNLRKDVLVAIVILGIYTFYVIKSIRMAKWYFSLCRENGWIFNPIELLKTYVNKAILDEVQRKMSGLSIPSRLVMNFFGPSNAAIAGNIEDLGLSSAELRVDAIARIVMWLFGWGIYILVYEKLFLYATGVDFNAVWEPFVWPFHVMKTVLATR